MSLRRYDNDVKLEKLGRFASAAAKETAPGKPVSVLNTVKTAYKRLGYIKSVMQDATAYADEHVSLPQGAEWLLDNWYIAEREGKSAARDLKTAKHLNESLGRKRELVVLYAAQALIASGGGSVTAERIETYLDAFQDVVCLSETELSVFIPSLKLALIEWLSDACRELKTALNNNVFENDLALAFERCFTSLRFLSGLDASEILENVNRIERTLRQDPAGVYPQMDEHTRFLYRHEIARLADEIGEIASATAEKALALSKADQSHVGYYIFTRPPGREKKPRSGALYIAFIILSSLFIALLISFALENPAISILLMLPVSEIIKNITDYFIMRFSRPRRVPRLELKAGVPEDGRTLCVVSVLLSSEKSGAAAARLLEEYRLANRDAGRNLVFGILADLPDAPSDTAAYDEKYLKSASDALGSLNKKYGDGFFLFCRGRRFNGRDIVFSAWERKRGAVLELCRFLRKRTTKLKCLLGRVELLDNLRYVITLDSDTRLCAGTARELIGSAMHPLNKPVIDKAKGIVVSGSGIIQPRIAVDLAAANQTCYTRVFAGQGGIDPYGGMTGDIYQNLFGAGSFAGKGLIDVDAYLACLDDRFPENTILSHDLLEGAYLRCAFAGDIELTDGYPAKVTTYYDRMHRWTRGDWQSAPWMGRLVKNGKGKKENNVLPQIDRWKIADNIRRSLVPVFTMASLVLGMLFGTDDFIWASIAAVLSAVSHLIIASAADMFNRKRGRVKYQSAVISGVWGQFLQTLIRLVLLPYEAWVCFSAIVTALWRMLITHRRMLEWVTAADSERRTNNSVVHVLRRMWPSLAIALFIVIFTPFISAAIVSGIWVLSPLLVLYLGRRPKRGEGLEVEDKLMLSRFAGGIWRYFDELITPEDHYLPPDNFQEQPAVGTAHRTSPTNIGLALLSALAAFDLNASAKERTIEVITHILDTIKILPKWNGHLFNWYDTLTLRVLHPSYVSTVDSGNFAGCLIALREGLLELGETELADTAEELLLGMSFLPLYDKKRQLFYIGLDIDKNSPTEGWYDLLASEARQTSYIAIARGDIPRKHWRKLGRSLVTQDGYRGMASWTGTMFEYFMPELLLPCYTSSLVYESLKFCLYVQKKRAKDIPWGMSESAFYAFDHTLSYQYKAHGAQRLALKRGMGRESVVSPYSTFLALQLDPKASAKNLRRLSDLGMEGRYGLFEAVDFTASRVRNGQYEIVRTFMSHHLGMSLLAIDNVLNNGIMQRRFMRDREMASYAELLQEKVPVGGLVLRQTPREIPDKPSRSNLQRWQKLCPAIDYRNPRCTVLSNGAYTVTASETGQTRSVWNNIAMTRTSSDQLGPDAGLSFYIKSGSELVSLLPSPVFDPGVHYSADLTGSYCRIDAKSGNLSAAMIVSVPEDEAGELRLLELTSSVKREVELVCYFEPVLSRLGDYLSHPAFSKLSLETTQYDGSIVIKRRPRARGRGIALAFDCDCPYTFDTSRELALGRGGIRAILPALSHPAGETVGAVLDPCVLMRVHVRLDPGVTSRIKFALTTASSIQSASAAAKRILTSESGVTYARLDETARQLGFGVDQIDQAMAILPDIVYHSPDRRIAPEDAPALARGQSGLWSLGVSGDLPIVASEINDENDISKAGRLLGTHRLLTQNNVSFDLVYLIKGGGDYRSKLKNSLVESLKLSEPDRRLGARGGVHLAELPSEAAELVRAVSVVTAQSGEPENSPIRDETVKPVSRPFLQERPEEPLSYHYNSDNSFTFESGILPKNAWSHMLANESFGYIASDAGTGHMWHLNARENKLNRWLNDSLTTDGTEKLKVAYHEMTASLFAAPDGFQCEITYGFGWARWVKRIDGAVFKTTAFVPVDTSARILIIESENAEFFDVTYYTDLVMAPDDENSVYVETSHTPGVLMARNPYNTAFPDTVFYLTASSPETSFTCSKSSFETGCFDHKTGAGFPPCAAAVYKTRGALVIVTGCDELDKLRALTSVDAARAKLRETTQWWRNVTSKLVVNTPSEDLNHYVNGWATYQTLACRVFGRSSLYQSGGAYGFRDQLQDICSLFDETPEIARAHLIRAAGHQFLEGDVQHWWHPGKKEEGLGDKGVRTRCSDDLLWLPYALCQYVQATGDTSIYDEPAPYLTSSVLADDEDERYEQPKIADVTEPLIRHAVRAVDLALRRGTGEHGLAFIGSGDWNDGLNLVGARGKGESVWLTWFLSVTAEMMSKACLAVDNPGAASRFADAAESLKTAAENAWDGDWYIRGYYDDGSPLGSCSSDECNIDSIAQSFAALAGGDRDKTKTALISSVERLTKDSDRVVRLFDPPFSQGLSVPGYIKGYSPGFRENGGQYTHGAVWLAMGLFLEGMTDEGWHILNDLLPQGRPNDVYRTEPYVLAADVYSAPGHVGRGGWTWYTGAAGWFKRVALENLLGLRLIDGKLHVSPLLPSSWGGFEADWNNGGSVYHIKVSRDGQVDVTQDGKDTNGSVIVENHHQTSARS